MLALWETTALAKVKSLGWATGLGQQREGNARDGGPAGTSCFIILTLVIVHIYGMMFLFILTRILSPGHTKRTSGNYLIL